MLTRLRFERFRGFTSFDADVAAITAFLGSNSSGKTTALHAIRLACDALRLALDADAPVRPDGKEGGWIIVARGIVVDPARLLPLADWCALFVDQAVRSGTYFAIGLTFEDHNPIQELDVRVECGHNEQLKLTVRARSAQAQLSVVGLPPRSGQVGKRLSDFLRQHAPVAVFVPPFYGTVIDEEVRARIVIDRLLGSGDQSHVVRNLVAALEPEQLERLNAFLRDAVGATLTYRTSGDALQSESPMRVRFRDSNGELELSAAGAGLVNLIALYAALSRWRRETTERSVLFLLDEPEAHLHPRLQAESAAFLGRVATREFGAQLLLATHSVDILNRLACDGHRLLRCDRTREPSIVVLDRDSALFDDLAEWVDLTPYTAINVLASRKVLFVEGKSESALLPLLGQLRYRNDAARYERFRQWAIVELAGTTNRPIADLLARLVRSDAIRARGQQGAFEVVVALDCDYERTPGVSQQRTGPVSQTTVVWPAHSLESLFLAPPVLAAWLRAYLGDKAPGDLTRRVSEAVLAADQDRSLNEQAVAALIAAEVSAQMRSGVPVLADSGAALCEKSVEAQRKVADAPALWQRGKDRATFVLRALREGLGPGVAGHLPTDLTRLVSQADPNQIGDPFSAIPAPIIELLDHMARP